MPQELTVCGLNTDALVKLAAEWQTRLRLEDWDIRIQIVDPRAIADAHADNTWSTHKKTAEIRIASDAPSKKDLVDSIVHELLHLHFFWVKEEGVESDLLEIAFRRICDVIAEQDMQLTQRKRKK